MIAANRDFPCVNEAVGLLCRILRKVMPLEEVVLFSGCLLIEHQFSDVVLKLVDNDRAISNFLLCE